MNGCGNTHSWPCDCPACQAGDQQFDRLATEARDIYTALGWRVYVNKHARVFRVIAPARGRLDMEKS